MLSINGLNDFYMLIKHIDILQLFYSPTILEIQTILRTIYIQFDWVKVVYKYVVKYYYI